jgi:ABC-2 type transport system permease protein
MRRIWLIARREYLYNFKRRAYLFTAFGVPLFTIVMMYIIFTMTGSNLTETGQLGNIGYIDQAGVLVDAVDKPEEYIAFSDEASAHQALLDGEIGAYFVVVEDFFNAGEVDAYAPGNIPEGIEDQFSDFVQANLADGVPAEVPIERILSPLREMRIIELDTGDEITDDDALVGRILAPFIFAMIFLMAVNTTSQFLMSGVVEEKENRMMEVLVTSSTPLEMLWGKVLGLGALGLTQVLIWAIAGYFLINLQGENAFIQGLAIEPGFALMALVYLILGYFLFGSIMAGIGAAVTAEQEGRQFAGIFTLIAVIPLMLSVSFITDPNGTLPVVFSFIPITSPIAMLMRMPLTNVPAWQIIASIILLILSVAGTIWVAARIFRIGLLMYGKRLRFRDLWNAVRQGRKTQITTAQTEGA